MKDFKKSLDQSKKGKIVDRGSYSKFNEGDDYVLNPDIKKMVRIFSPPCSRPGKSHNSN